MARFCTNCGNSVPDGANACSNCGTMMGSVATPTVQPQVVVNNVQAQPAKGNGLATAGLITSLVSSILCCGSFNLISLILSIIGLVKSKELGGAGKGMAIAGIVISAIGMIILLLLTIFGYAASFIENYG